MSIETRAVGTLTFSNPDELAFLLSEFDDEEYDEVRDAMIRHGSRLEMAAHVYMSNRANLWFQEWISDLADAATGGHIDTWQESFGSSRYVRVMAGGEEIEVEAPFPGADFDLE